MQKTSQRKPIVKGKMSESEWRDFYCMVLFDQLTNHDADALTDSGGIITASALDRENWHNLTFNAEPIGPPNPHASEGFDPDFCRQVICFDHLREKIERSEYNPEADALLSNGGVIVVFPQSEMNQYVADVRFIPFPPSKPKRKRRKKKAT